jgi:hypothetical protein
MLRYKLGEPMKKMIYLVLVFISTSSFADDKSLGYLEKSKEP